MDLLISSLQRHRIMIFAAALCFTFIAAPLILTYFRSPPAKSTIVNIPLRDVHAHLGDLPVSGSEAYNGKSINWIPLRDVMEQTGRDRYTGYIWLRIPLPENEWRDPSLYISRAKAFEAYIGDRLLHSFNTDKLSFRFNPYLRWHLIHLDKEDPGNLLYMRVYTDDWTTQPGMYAIGNSDDFLLRVFRQNSAKLVFGCLYSFIGLVALLFFLRHREDKLILYVALLALTAWYGSIARTGFMSLLPDSDLFVYFHDLSLPFGTFAFLGFMEQINGPGRFKYLTRLKQWMLIFTLVCLVVGIADDVMYRTLIRYAYPIAFLPVFLLLLLLIIRNFSKQRDRETIWITVGFGQLMLTCFVYTLVIFSPGVQRLLTPYPDLYYYLGEEQLFVGIFVLICCLTMVLVDRFRALHQQVRDYSTDLEAKVEERTADLAEANERLRLQAQETAEVMAELSVLDERNRISKDIHDVVGHTLTTTIVQIEAAKRLLSRDLESGISKLDISQELVRKSLEDIRRSVHTLSGAGAEFDLREELERLLRETEEHAGVSVSYYIESLPALSALQKKIIFRSLQEGLTNGIRHGSASSFDFQLVYRDGRLDFTLINDGRRYSGERMGFGLKSMQERLAQQGGSLRIEAAGDQGSVLKLTIPVD